MGRLLCLDYGQKRVGLAITDGLRMLSTPFDVYPNNAELLPKLKKLCREYQFDFIVLGYPHSETTTESSDAVKAFAGKLREALGLEVVFQDEQFTTVYADAYLKSIGKSDKEIRSIVDKFAAQKILEDFLKAEKEGR